MNKKISLIAIIGLTLALPVVGQTNATSTNLCENPAPLKVEAQTRLNQVMVEMLSGVKNASGEIYGASKQAIKKSVDFAVEQAPDVVHQFMAWKLCVAVIWLLMWGAFCFLLYWVGRSLKKYGVKNETSDYKVIGSVFHYAAAFMLVLALAFQGIEIVEITLAPKVYMIEYISSLIVSH